MATKVCPKCKEEREESMFRDEKGQRRVKCSICCAGKRRGRPRATVDTTPKATVIDGVRYCATGGACVGGPPGKPNPLSKYNKAIYCYACRDAEIDRQLEAS